MRYIAAILFVALVGCSDNRTVDYFEKHPDELQGALSQCDQSGTRAHVNCSAADQVEANVTARMRKENANKSARIVEELTGYKEK